MLPANGAELICLVSLNSKYKIGFLQEKPKSGTLICKWVSVTPLPPYTLHIGWICVLMLNNIWATWMYKFIYFYSAYLLAEAF